MKINWNRKYNTVAVYVILVFLICYGIYKLTNSWDQTNTVFKVVLKTLSPFIYALTIAYFLNPLVQRIEFTFFKKLQNEKLKRSLSILTAYVLVISSIVILLSFIMPQLIDSVQEIARLPGIYLPIIDEFLSQDTLPIFDSEYYIDMTFINRYFNDNIKETVDSLTNMVQNFAPKILTYLSRFASALMNILLGFIIAIYLLLTKEVGLRTARKVILAILPSKHAINLINLGKESNQIFINFIIGKLLDSLIIGFLAFIVLLIFRFPYALLLSVIIGVTNIIPYFGPFIGGIIGFALLLFINPVQALWFMVFILILQQFDGNILGPKILGDSTGLSPFWVIFSIIIFGKFFGFVGMFVGVPIVAVLKNIITRQIDRLYNHRMKTL
jgi:predicted PurR-regulated permease PerM